MTDQDAQEYLDDMVRERGYVLEYHKRLVAADYEFARAANDIVDAAYLKPRLLDRKTKELAIIVACVALKDSTPHLQCHMHAAKNAGATPEEILELIELIGSWTGSVARINGLEAWRATFRPDLPSIERVEGGDGR